MRALAVAAAARSSMLFEDVEFVSGLFYHTLDAFDSSFGEWFLCGNKDFHIIVL